MILRLALLILFFPVLARASEIVRFSSQKRCAIVTQPTERHWRVSDYVCTTKSSEERACGVVLFSNAKGAIVQWEFRNGPLAKGDQILEPSKTPARKLALKDKSANRFIADENPKEWKKSVL